jgi:hypothetical protein
MTSCKPMMPTRVDCDPAVTPTRVIIAMTHRIEDGYRTGTREATRRTSSTGCSCSG